MSAPTLTRRPAPLVRGGSALVAAAAVTGVALVAEAVASTVVDSHVGYHSLNTVLDVALVVATVALALTGSTAIGRAGVVGAWGTAVTAFLAAAGGAWTVAVEGLSSADSPGVVEGVAHTAVLVSILFMVPLGVGLRRLDRRSGLVIAVSSACLVAMVIVGLDQPEAFLVPEAVLGVGWVLLSRALRAGGARP